METRHKPMQLISYRKASSLEEDLGLDSEDEIDDEELEDESIDKPVTDMKVIIRERGFVKRGWILPSATALLGKRTVVAADFYPQPGPKIPRS